MNAFKKMVEGDRLAVFLNLEEFGELRLVEGKTITVVIAPDQNLPIGGGYTLGVSESSIVLQAAVEDLPKRKASGQSISVDGKEYTIDRWNEHMGIAELYLSQTHGY